MSTLHDQPARDRFIQELERNFCVSAGAGVGKTTAIVERIATLAREHAEDLPRLVVVTYAKSAAEELRARSREKLLKTAASPGRLEILVIVPFKALTRAWKLGFIE